MKITIRKPKKSEYNQVVKVVNSELVLYKKFFTKEELKGIGIGFVTEYYTSEKKKPNLKQKNQKTGKQSRPF